ncbi:curli assembly protein CsgF [Paracandidimonas soli]|nr:curli assembly protein CsgF [Paracandidimonas soli]
MMSAQKQPRIRSAVLTLCLCAGTTSAGATELVYYPLNPSFGGSPLNGPVLLNSAIATNKHKAPDIDSDRLGIEQRTPLQNFQESLERSILNRLSSAAASKLFDAQGNFVPGTLQTENFIITIADMGGGIFSVTTEDKSTGNVTTFQVSSLGGF